MKKLFFLVALLAAKSVCAQSVHEVEQEVNSLYGRITKYNEAVGDTSLSTYDSIARLNKELLDYLMKVVRNNRALLNNELHVDRGFGTVTSRDHKVKIYWWNTEEGGTMRAYNAVMQFETKKGVSAKVLNDVSVDDSDGHFNYGSFYKKIIPIKRRNQDTVYLVLK